ncbi:MAG: leucine-rich repeat domain-containing protein [Clostridia bacterium]|nr:leucine-rich repeat domain-containing protein [Clostridia bacterium]
MALVELKCRNCNGDLHIESSLEKAFCPYCGTPYIVKDEIIHQQITNNININGENINVYANKDFDIQGGVLKKYNGEALDVVIPETVRVIEGEAFADLSIEKVTIPGTVREMRCTYAYEKGAFSGCKFLTEVILSEGVSTIGACAFKKCSSLQHIRIPNSVTTIESMAFLGCQSLQHVIIPNGVTIIKSGAFSGCSSLREIILPDSIKEIGDAAFSGCSSLEKVSLPDGLTIISDRLFSDCCSLVEVTLPMSVKRINNWAFNGCSSLVGVHSQRKQVIISNCAFDHCNKLTEVPVYILEGDRTQIEWYFGEYSPLSRRLRNLCQYCGSEFSFFTERCKNKNCKRPKDY